MRALSLTQPWASLVAIGAKQIETRSWSTPFRGRLALHASKSFPGWAKEACDEDPFYGVLTKAELLWPVGDETLVLKADERYAALPLGAIVATAELVEVFLTGDCLNHVPRGAEFFLGSRGHFPLTEQEVAFGDFSAGRFAWLLSEIRRLEAPIPCKGALGLWTVPDEIARQLEGR